MAILSGCSSTSDLSSIDTAADTCAECNCNKIANTLADTCDCFAESSTVCIIFKINGLTNSFFKHFLCRNLVEFKIIGKFNITVVFVN